MILEEILSDIGDAGRFQFLFTFVILFMEVVIAWSMLQTAIIGATPDWWCVDPATVGTSNMTLDASTFQQCQDPGQAASPLLAVAGGGPASLLQAALNATTQSPLAQGLNNTIFNGATAVMPTCVRYYDPSMTTIVSEWDLVCERKYIKASINSIQMAGVLLGSILCGQSSDLIGRRITCYVTLALHAVTCLVAGLSNSWQMYAVFRFFVGGALGSYLVLHYVYVIEFVRHTWRPYIASIPSWALGAGCLCLTAWLVPYWRSLHFIAAGLSLPFMAGWFVSPESLRWLAAKGRVEEAERVVALIAKMNGKEKAGNTGEQLTLLAQEEATHGDQERRHTYLSLFTGGWRNVMKTLVLGFAWMTLSMSFYGIIFGVSSLHGNLFLNMFLLSVLEVPFILGTSFFVIKLGRRWTACMFFLCASLTGFGILIADRSASEDMKQTIKSVVAIASKCFIAAAWTAMQTFTTELYPTVIRSLGLGAANTAARVGAVLAPFVLEMDTEADTVQCYVIVGSLMAISALSVLLLGETKGKALADTLHQDQKQLNLHV